MGICQLNKVTQDLIYICRQKALSPLSRVNLQPVPGVQMIECRRTIHEEKKRGETRGGKECLLLRDGKMVLSTFSFSVHDIYVREKKIH